MKRVIKNIISLILPFTVLYLVPMWIESDWIIKSTINLVLGGILGLIGFSIMYKTISSFIQIGHGTLAPWSPTQRLVVTGLYRYVRNPMIVGVFLVLISESITINSISILEWAGLFLVINTIYFKLSEEPGLEKRFGEEYTRYKKEVGMWIPRLTPYSPEERK